MTESRRRVASKATLRLVAWSSAAVALVASWGVLGTMPKPSPPTAAQQTRPRTVVIVDRIVRRVIAQGQAAPPAVTFSPGQTGSRPAQTSTGGSAP
ncbi:MAG: hypothetical protein M3M93_02060 [Actinomycetota bacterium]|nr:hypothetical protein [Actinomycetota bacterium]